MTNTGLLTQGMTVEQAQILDQRLQTQRDAPFRQAPQNYGGGAMGGLLSASGQAINSAALAGRNIGEFAGDAMTGRTGRGQENTIAAVERRDAIQGQETKQKQQAQQILNIGASKFSDDPIENIEKRITALQGLVETHPTAAAKIAEQESFLQEYLDSKGNRQKTAAEINNLNQKKAIETANLEIKKAELENNRATVELAENKFDLEKQKAKQKQGNILRAETDKKQKIILAQKNSDSRIQGTINSVKESKLTDERKNQIINGVARKIITPEQAWSFIKPLTEKENADITKTLAETVKIKSEGGDSRTIKSSKRGSFLKSIKDNGYEVSSEAFKSFMSKGDAGLLTQNITLSDSKTKELVSIVDQSVSLLENKDKQDFLAFRTDMLNKNLPLRERIDLEANFLSGRREVRNAKEFDAKLSNFEAVKNNLTGLDTRLKAIFATSVDADGTLVNADFSPNLYMFNELFSSKLHLAGSPEREVYNITQTLKSNAVLETMAELKRLSPNGATGFGATNTHEIGLLESDIASLDPADNNFLKNATSIVTRLISLSEQGQGIQGYVSGEVSRGGDYEVTIVEDK